MQESLPRRICDYLYDTQLNLGICAMMALTNGLDRSGMMVYADDPLVKQAELALPSALPTPVTTGNLAIDIGIQVAETTLTTEIVRRTSSAKQLLGTALTAQVVSCGADAFVERAGWLSPAERMQPDIGFSAISAAWFSKFFLDRADRAQSPLRKGLWRTTLAVYSGLETGGYYFLNGVDGGKLDLVAHGSGVIVGIASHVLCKRGKTAS